MTILARKCFYFDVKGNVGGCSQYEMEEFGHDRDIAQPFSGQS